MNTRKTLFISDLHLDKNQPEITGQFLSILEQCDDSVDALYILGDLFESWIGDDDDTPYHRQIKQALRHVTQKNIPVYLMHGNRDFMMGKQFIHETGCTLLTDEEKIFLYGTPVLLMHGDTLCTQDHAYLKARKLSRNRFIQQSFLWMPLYLRRLLAKRMRARSARYTQSALPEIMDVTQSEVERIMLKHEVKYLIHGHTHKPNTHRFSLNGAFAVRHVLAAWHDRGSAIVWDETGHIETVYL